MTKISTDIKDFISIDQNYIKEITTENTILKIVANGFLISQKVPQELKEEIIKCVGKRWFQIDKESKEVFFL